MKTREKEELDFETRVIHAGQKPDPITGAIITPIYATSTYVQESPGKHMGYQYARTQNPTRQVYEQCIANLEGGKKALAFPSGMAAISTVLEILDYGSHIIVMDSLYQGSRKLFTQIKQRTAGLKFTFVDLDNIEALQRAIIPETKMIWIETPSNPLLKLADLNEIAKVAKSHRILTVADNTFATPWIQRPLEYGIDIVVHSTTKYLNGHSDVIGGIIVVGDNENLIEKLAFIQNATGAIPSPFDSFLSLRGVKTLALRMERHCENALKMAHWLENHSKIESVFYPGLKSHPQCKLAKQQMRHFGGVIAVFIKGGQVEAKRMLEQCRLFSLAESLGGVESLINLPSLMTHSALSLEARLRLGIKENLIRISVGIENYKDLQNDLDYALKF